VKAAGSAAVVRLGRVRIRPDLEVDGVGGLLPPHGIRHIALFGSALGNDFGPESDIDLLVEFHPGRIPGLLALAAMELELAELFGGREVDFRTAALSAPTSGRTSSPDRFPVCLR
jgi:uncharacterized protein